MKILRFIISLIISLSLGYIFSNGLEIGNNRVPPAGHFLNPFEGFWQNATAEKLSFSPIINLAGLKAPVSIAYDSSLIPHIKAANDHDLYLAQGYVVANLRLWQMEFQTHAAAGRISELIGEKAIRFDRLQRRKGMIHGAEKNLAYLKQDTALYSLVEAYAAGVNMYISSLSYRDLPLEYKLMDYTPEEWTPLKTALILQYMTDNLTGFDNDLENTNIRNLYGSETFDLLFPEYPEGIEPTIATNPDSLWGFDPIPASTISDSSLNVYTSVTHDKPDPDNGSNNWAVSGTKTKSGYPILCNDTHLGLNLPSLWVMMQLQSPSVNVYGYTFAGALGITIGHNNATAWGFTNAPRDTRDWYNITFKDDSKAKYRYDNGWRDSKQFVEKISVRGSDPYYDTIIYTHHGPITYDDNFLSTDYKEQYYALKWNGHAVSKVQNAILDLNRASDYQQHIQAIENWDSPPQNIIFSSTQGDIAITVQGNFPLKWAGQGKFIMDGSNPEHEWGENIPKAHNARELNPSRGYISSANQHSVDSLYPYYYYNDYIEYYRNRRINRLLSDMDQITVDDMRNMLMDSYSIEAEELLPIMLGSIDTSKLSEVQIGYIDLLKDWDYVYRADTQAPSLFNIWWNNLYTRIWDEFRIDSLAMTSPSEYNTYLLMRDRPELDFFDIQNTRQKETLKDLINLTFNDMADSVQKNPDYNWGNYKATKIVHLARLKELSILDVAVDGHANAINSTKRQHGPSQRLVVEMSTPPRSFVIYPGGQSGNPGSYYYDNFVEQWRTGQLIQSLFMQPGQNYDHQIMISQTLTPSQK